MNNGRIFHMKKETLLDLINICTEDDRKLLNEIREVLFQLQHNLV